MNESSIWTGLCDTTRGAQIMRAEASLVQWLVVIIIISSGSSQDGVSQNVLARRIYFMMNQAALAEGHASRSNGTCIPRGF
jgi:hypothetical protein